MVILTVLHFLHRAFHNHNFIVSNKYDFNYFERNAKLDCTEPEELTAVE